jgi:hypothetical protein
MTEGQAYQIDLDPINSVIRLTVTAETVTLELAEDIYRHLSEAASSGGPYAAIFDLSAAKHTTISTDTVRAFARRRPSVPTGRKQVVVGKEGHMYGLARLFQISGENVGKEFEVVQTLEEAYQIVEARPEDFTQRL